MMNPLYSSWNNALDYSRYPRGNTAPTVLPQMHYRYLDSTVQSIPSPRYYREILPIPTVITAVTPLPCHSLVCSVRRVCTSVTGDKLPVNVPRLQSLVSDDIRRLRLAVSFTRAVYREQGQGSVIDRSQSPAHGSGTVCRLRCER